MIAIAHHMFLQQDEDIYEPFALEEVLCREVGEGRLPSPILHVWRHERALVIGLRDSRLPHAREAMERLEKEGLRVMVRNSGGAAVPLDGGVLNVTLIGKGGAGHFRMKEDFTAMAALLAETLAPFGVAFTAGEVQGSYCPGEFDLSIRGRKFCGLAQRRQLRGFAVQSFVNAEGDSLARARLVREFYRSAAGDEGILRPDALDVRVETMGSLTELHPGFPGAQAWQNTLLSRFPKAFDSGSLLRDMYRDDVRDMIRVLKSRYDPRYAAGPSFIG